MCQSHYHSSHSLILPLTTKRRNMQNKQKKLKAMLRNWCDQNQSLHLDGNTNITKKIMNDTKRASVSRLSSNFSFGDHSVARRELKTRYLHQNQSGETTTRMHLVIENNQVCENNKKCILQILLLNSPLCLS